MAIYHVTTREQWTEAEQAGTYAADTLLAEGFIHCAKFEQLTHVIETYFSETDDLVGLVIEPSMLRAPVRYEGSGEEQFPHVYGEIPLSAVVRVINFSSGNSFTNAI